jgi:hypothetical protein
MNAATVIARNAMVTSPSNAGGGQNQKQGKSGTPTIRDNNSNDEPNDSCRARNGEVEGQAPVIVSRVVLVQDDVKISGHILITTPRDEKSRCAYVGIPNDPPRIIPTLSFVDAI